MLQIVLDFPNEYVTQVKGTTGKVGSLRVITSLTFITNKQTYGPYGAVTGTEFGSPAGLLVTGFFGKGGDSLDQFGVFTTADSESTTSYLQVYGWDWRTITHRFEDVDVSSFTKTFDFGSGRPREPSKAVWPGLPGLPGFAKPSSGEPGKPQQPGFSLREEPVTEQPRPSVARTTGKEPKVGYPCRVPRLLLISEFWWLVGLHGR